MRRSVTVFTVGAFVGMLVLAASGPRLALASPVREEDGAWAQVRAQLPAGVPVLAPAWLPARFADASSTVETHNDQISGGPSYRVSYQDAMGDVLIFALGSAVNSARPDVIEPVAVRGVPGELWTTPAWPPLAVVWKGGSWQNAPLVYTVQAHGVSRDELLRVVANLRPVGVDAKVSGLPQTGAAALATRGERAMVGAVGAAVLAGGLLLARRFGRRYHPWLLQR